MMLARRAMRREVFWAGVQARLLEKLKVYDLVEAGDAFLGSVGAVEWLLTRLGVVQLGFGCRRVRRVQQHLHQ